MQIDPSDLARLRSQASRGELVLFTGAGFSLGAKDYSGRVIPSSAQLKREIWDICYPDEQFDDTSSLGDLYGAALRRKKTELERLLRERLSVDPASLPEYYGTIFTFPWFRCYTLNVDDLESAVARRFGAQRQPVSISARTGDGLGKVRSTERGLEVIHLNGMIPDSPELLTFSESQYAERIRNQEPWYSCCVVDITARPVVFVGTGLNESLFWQHMELRRRRETLGRDLRPTSILVTRNLSRPRRDILRDLRINWVEGTAEEFAAEVMPNLAAEAASGFAFIRQHMEGHGTGVIPLVSQLAAEDPSAQTEYLLGEEPRWADLLSGRAIERAHDRALLEFSEDVVDGKRPSTAIAISGTAGTGKSTALMSLALKLSATGIPVLWIDKDSEITPAKMRNAVRNAKEKIVLAIDDADMYGRELVNLLSDLVPESKGFLFVFAARSSKLDAITTAAAKTSRLRLHEHVVPPLNDEDIDGLIAVLDKNKRLGILTGASDDARRAAFRDLAGRQLLVAMIRATSGENFEKKAQGEFLDLKGAQRYAYGLVVVATALRYTISKDEVLLAFDDSHEEALVALERLSAHHLIVPQPPVGQYRCRHRVIADLVFDTMKEQGELGEVLTGLTWALATKIGTPPDRHSRTAKFLIRLMNHDFLLRTIKFMNARELYTKLEPLLSSDYHYWLQRGSLEVEVGDIRKAENFLGAARSLGADDFRVTTAYGYMLMRKACEAPADTHAEEYLEAGMEQLESVIETSGSLNEYPYHVFGSQGLAWVHRGIARKDDKRAFLNRLLEVVGGGLEQHPGAEKLMALSRDLKKEMLLTVASA
ncbi:MAG: SIR2 family protein [Candidatus Acidiferrales bacterium]